MPKKKTARPRVVQETILYRHELKGRVEKLAESLGFVRASRQTGKPVGARSTVIALFVEYVLSNPEGFLNWHRNRGAN